ncbi:MAG: hypothetical protein U0031_22015 [Thermomicrobiales bacterium]
MDFRRIDADLAAGLLSEAEWYEQNGHLLETAYLAGDNPQRQSGLNGDAAHWERRRHVIVEASDRDGRFLAGVLNQRGSVIFRPSRDGRPTP